MKVRVITGVVWTLAMVAMLLLFPTWAMRLLFEAVCILAMRELLAAGSCDHKGVTVAAMLFAAACPFLDMAGDFRLFWVALISYIFTLVVIQIFSFETLKLEKTMYVFAVSVMIVLPIASMAYIRAIPVHGKAFLPFPMIVSWLSDTGAYFTGSFFGKHKLCEKISPKKTVEGFFGGIVCAVLFSMLGAFLYQVVVLNGMGLHISYGFVALAALIAAPLSVLGDLFCSVIKRRFGIKDYGNMFPGHGGIMDRFDSIIFVAPLMYVLCTQLPLVQ